MAPKFSVILPICHGGMFLTQALETLALLSSPRGGFEVVVAGTNKAIVDLSAFDSDRIELIKVVTEGTRSMMLNAACAVAGGTVWVFTDDDCVFPVDWLLNVEKSLITYPDAAVLGGMDIACGAKVFDLALDEVLNTFVGTGGIRKGDGMRTGRYFPKLWNMTVLADAARQAAPDTPHRILIFDPTLNVHEDVDLIERILIRGGEVAYAPNVRVGHCRDTTFLSFLKRNMDMAQVCRRRGIHRTAHLSLIIFTVGIPLLGGASLAVPMIGSIFLVLVCGYTMAVGIAGIKGAVRRKRAAHMGLIPALIVSLHAARSIGYICSFRVKKDLKP